MSSACVNAKLVQGKNSWGTHWGPPSAFDFPFLLSCLLETCETYTHLKICHECTCATGDRGYFKIRAGTDECKIESRRVTQPINAADCGTIDATDSNCKDSSNKDNYCKCLKTAGFPGCTCNDDAISKALCEPLKKASNDLGCPRAEKRTELKEAPIASATNSPVNLAWDNPTWRPAGGVRSGNVSDAGILEAANFTAMTSITPFCPPRPVSTAEPTVTLAAVRPVIFAETQIVSGLRMRIMLQVLTGC